MRIQLTPASRVLVLTGAGISAESGVPTFRDANGLWEGHDVTQVASPEGFASDPVMVWRFYAGRRAAMTGIVPNAGHRALVALEQRLGDRFLLATQNVDGLHAAAGSERMVEMHGNLMRTRCAVCDRAPFADTTAYPAGRVPVCGACRDQGRDALLRPDIVWFGEMLPSGALDRIGEFIAAAGRDLVFVAVGTSGLVYPAAGLVDATKRVGGTTWLVNLEAPANVTRFDHVVLGPAGRELPALFA
ncbi:MAG TPA: NAD-dependent deacylase [Kofleriaceae bacterium]|jgi:NAD-dependent deacetylase|nr:NAD-dependent deacylase [Kofleriaceae bacterium]